MSKNEFWSELRDYLHSYRCTKVEIDGFTFFITYSRMIYEVRAVHRGRPIKLTRLDRIFGHAEKLAYALYEYIYNIERLRGEPVISRG